MNEDDLTLKYRTIELNDTQKGSHETNNNHFNYYSAAKALKQVNDRLTYVNNRMNAIEFRSQKRSKSVIDIKRGRQERLRTISYQDKEKNIKYIQHFNSKLLQELQLKKVQQKFRKNQNVQKRESAKRILYQIRHYSYSQIKSTSLKNQKLIQQLKDQVSLQKKTKRNEFFYREKSQQKLLRSFRSSRLTQIKLQTQLETKQICNQIQEKLKQLHKLSINKNNQLLPQQTKKTIYLNVIKERRRKMPKLSAINNINTVQNYTTDINKDITTQSNYGFLSMVIVK